MRMQKLSRPRIDCVVVMDCLLAESIDANTRTMQNMQAYSLILFLMHVVIGSNCM